MHKKLIMACMAIVAFASFVVVPAASASPALTDEGKLLAAGSSIEGKNTGNVKFTASGFTIECSIIILKGTVTADPGGSIKITTPVGGFVVTGTGSGGDCTSPLGSTKVTFTSELCFETSNDNMIVTGCGHNIEFHFEVTGTGDCLYSTASVTGTFLTSSGATVNVSEQPAKKVAGGIFCPSEGRWDMDFDLYTQGKATQLTIS